MAQTRRQAIGTAIGAAAVLSTQAPGSTRYIRFRKGSTTAYGIAEGTTVTELRGDPFVSAKASGAKHKLADVKLLYPCVPPKIIAVGLNYKSHIGSRTPPSRPEIFYKPISCLQHPEEPIVIQEGAKNVHYEGELVLVIGKPAVRVSPAQARDVIFGVTCGNDVSERDWQSGSDKDLQWWRAKGADTFGPMGPAIVTGLDYDKLQLTTRLNGQVVQQQSTSDLLFKPTDIVSFVSRYVALGPGDVIYTGTPGATKKMNAGDVVEVEIESVGILRNKVAASS
jgi:2-keto-4-pentenoate hydratase/2-oxohepta-3-ene-1,7-dioic acid hydratase in catechol pathway